MLRRCSRGSLPLKPLRRRLPIPRAAGGRPWASASQRSGLVSRHGARVRAPHQLLRASPLATCCAARRGCAGLPCAAPGAEIAGSSRGRRERRHTDRRRSRLRSARLLHWAREHGPVHVTSRGQRDERLGGCAPRSPTGGPNGKRLPARTRRRRRAHPFGLGAGRPKVRGQSQSAQSPSGDCNPSSR